MPGLRESECVYKYTDTHALFSVMHCKCFCVCKLLLNVVSLNDCVYLLEEEQQESEFWRKNKIKSNGEGNALSHSHMYTYSIYQITLRLKVTKISFVNLLDGPRAKKARLSDEEDDDGKGGDYHRSDPQIAICLDCLRNNGQSGESIVKVHIDSIVQNMCTDLKVYVVCL